MWQGSPYRLHATMYLASFSCWHRIAGKQSLRKPVFLDMSSLCFAASLSWFDDMMETGTINSAHVWRRHRVFWLGWRDSPRRKYTKAYNANRQGIDQSSFRNYNLDRSGCWKGLNNSQRHWAWKKRIVAALSFLRSPHLTAGELIFDVASYDWKGIHASG